MSFLKLSFIGISSADDTISDLGISANEELAYLMKTKGVRKRLDLSVRQDLLPIYWDAEKRATRQDSSCEAKSLSQMHVKQGASDWIAGYEVYVHCVDAPSPAVGYYFDVNGRFLQALDLAD
jgi:hypothetical protein